MTRRRFMGKLCDSKRVSVTQAPRAILHQSPGQRSRAGLRALWKCVCSFGASELRLGAGLRGCGIGVGDGTTSFGRERVQISTKVGRVLRPGAKERFMFAGGAEFHETFDYTGAGIDASLEQSRCRLGMSKADFLVIHDLEPERHGDDGGVDRRLDELAGAGAGWSRGCR